MKGKVRWFSADKGYGFIHGEDGVDRFLHVQAIQGADLPVNGVEVEFDPSESKRGPRAVNVRLTGDVQRATSDERAQCQSCGKRMVPRVILGYPAFSNHPIPRRSVCPFCGEVHKQLNTEKWDNNAWIFGLVVFAILGFFVALMS